MSFIFRIIFLVIIATASTVYAETPAEAPLNHEVYYYPDDVEEVKTFVESLFVRGMDMATKMNRQERLNGVSGQEGMCSLVAEAVKVQFVTKWLASRQWDQATDLDKQSYLLVAQSYLAHYVSLVFEMYPKYYNKAMPSFEVTGYSEAKNLFRVEVILPEAVESEDLVINELIFIVKRSEGAYKMVEAQLDGIGLFAVKKKEFAHLKDLNAVTAALHDKHNQQSLPVCQK